MDLLAARETRIRAVGRVWLRDFQRHFLVLDVGCFTLPDYMASNGGKLKIWKEVVVA
jgi:hypothetical protein